MRPAINPQFIVEVARQKCYNDSTMFEDIWLKIQKRWYGFKDIFRADRPYKVLYAPAGDKNDSPPPLPGFIDSEEVLAQFKTAGKFWLIIEK